MPLLNIFKKNAEKLEEAKALLATIPEGQALLDLARELDCPIMPQKIYGCSGRYIKFPKEHIILISPHLTVQGLTSTIAHELRHMWQHHHLPDIYKKDILYSTASHLAITRALEGDAFTFEKMMLKKINGKKADTHSIEFDNFQSSLTAALYDFQIFTQKRTKGGQLKTIFNDRAFAHAPDLRKILVPGLDTQATPYVTANSNEELLSGLLEISQKQRFKRALTWFAMH